MVRIYTVFLGLLLVCSLPAQAVVLENFYSATVPVANRDKATFTIGLRDALVQVLVKASARPEDVIKDEPRLAQDLANGEQLVEQFSFSQRKLTKSETGEPYEQLFLTASFPEKTILGLLQKGGLRLWPNDRPSTLVVPIVKELGVARLATGSQAADEQIRQQLQHQAELRGIPLQLPRADSLSNWRLEKLWQLNPTVIDELGKDYKAEAVLIARMAITGEGRILGGWQLSQADTLSNYDVNTETMAAFIDDGIAWLARSWANQYAVKLLSAENETLLVVNGIRNHQQYEALLDYLESIDIVDKVYLLEARQQQLQLAVALKTQVEQLYKTLQQDQKLQEMHNLDAGQYQAQYFWQQP